jgi:pyruvate dehydrogenase E1 component alpha subunit
MAVADVADRAAAYGFPGVVCNGNDLLAVHEAIGRAVARARAGEGPTLVECKTYRWHGHSEHDKAFYRTEEELLQWKSRDPIPIFQRYLQDKKVLTDQKLEAIEQRIAKEIEEAEAFAERSPFPEGPEALEDLYAP